MELYYAPASAPCRSVLMTAKAIGIELELKELNLLAGEHRTPQYAKINPQRIIPTLVDIGFAIWESRAIMIYLVEQYAKTDSLYPKNPIQRAVINQRLFFDMGTLYHSFADYYYPQIFGKAPADPAKFKKIEAAFDLMEIFLDGQKYAAGESLTVADISMVASVSNYVAAKFDISKYPKVDRWYKQCQTVIPGIELNQFGAEQLCKNFSN